MFSNILIMMGLKKDWPLFTVDEIASHCTDASLWIVAGDNVYDVTAFLFSHPGGSNALIKRGGGRTDCTRDLNFHSAKGRAEWTKYQIGVVDRSRSNRNSYLNHRGSSGSGDIGQADTVTHRSVVVSEKLSTSQTATSASLSPKTSTPLRPVECCCTKSPSARAASQPSAQHCAHCTCPDRPK